MSQQLINLSPDLSRLRDDGYEIQIRAEHLLISGVPYVTPAAKVALGTLVSELSLAGQITAKPRNHVSYFIGEAPCHRDGSPIVAIQHGMTDQTLAPDLIVNRSFSNKPKNGYPDYYEKMTRYIEIISAPARSLDPTLKAQTFNVIETEEGEAIFAYWDTNSSRAHISVISEKLKGHKIGIIGLGGTGAYVLDLVAKTPVAEIHLFDGDHFLQHNAFRTPGAPSIDLLKSKPFKVDHLANIYSNMHRGIQAHSMYIAPANFGMLDHLDFVFICVDRGSAKKGLFEHLVSNEIPFTDAGIGVETVDDRLLATVRVTSSSSKRNDHLQSRVQFGDGENDLYASNIQIAELNMMNATFAVIKWKKMIGFYHDSESENHSTYTLNCNLLLSEDPDPQVR